MVQKKDTSIKERIVKDTAKYNIAQYSSQVIGFFTAVAMRSFLGPYLMGIWSLLKVVMNYACLMNLGVDAAAAYKIPFYKGKNDKRAKAEVRDAAFGFLFLVSILSSIIVIIAAFILRHRYPQEVIIGLIFVSIYIVLQKLYSYYIEVLRANSNFSVISVSVVFDAVVNLALIFLLVRNFKLYGLYAAAMLMAVLNTFFVHILARYRIQFVFHLKRMASLIRFGFPLLILGFLGTILMSVDVIMIAKMLGIAFVGYYSIATMARNYLVGATNNFGIVTMPRMLEAYGKTKQVKDIQKFVTISAEAISYLLPILLGFIYLAMPLLVTKVLPRFIPGILAAQILLLDIFFRSCCPQARSFLIALNKQVKILPITITAILINIILNYIFIKMDFGIYGVAVGTSIATLFNFLCILIYAMSHFAETKEILLFILRILFPLLYITAVVISCSCLIKAGNAYLNLAISIAVLAVFSIPLLFYINRKTHILRLIFNSIKR